MDSSGPRTYLFQKRFSLQSCAFSPKRGLQCGAKFASKNDSRCSPVRFRPGEASNMDQYLYQKRFSLQSCAFSARRGLQYGPIFVSKKILPAILCVFAHERPPRGLVTWNLYQLVPSARGLKYHGTSPEDIRNTCNNNSNTSVVFKHPELPPTVVRDVVRCPELLYFCQESSPQDHRPS